MQGNTFTGCIKFHEKALRSGKNKEAALYTNNITDTAVHNHMVHICKAD